MSRVFWTNIPDLTYPDKNGKPVTVQASTCKIVLLAIADNANDYGENSWQSFDTLATKSSLQKRSVIRAVRALSENKYLVLDGISRYGTNNYTVNVGVLGQRPPRRGVGASDSTSLAKAPGSDSEALPSDSEAQGSDVKSPYPSLTIPKPSTSKEKTKLRGIEAAIAMGRPVTNDDLFPENNPAAAVMEGLSVLNRNWPKHGENKEWDRITRLISIEVENENGTVGEFVKWVGRQKDRIQRIQWYGRKPENVWEDWPLAFEADPEEHHYPTVQELEAKGML
jgi:hypothetical protein